VKHRPLGKLIAIAAVLLVAGLVPAPRHEVEIRIGSKKFTESVILGEVLRLLTEQGGLSATHYREFGGTRIVFDALAAGEIDAYPEYTGTILGEIFAGKKIADAESMRQELGKLGIAISESLGFNNTYGLALTRARAEALGVKTISDLVRHPELQLALTHEFLDRADCWPALLKTYDLPQKKVVGVDHDIAYRQLIGGEVDVIDVYSTDAVIRQADLVLLADDRQVFPRYEAVWLYRNDAADRYPAFRKAMVQTQGAISEAEMQALNDRVESRTASESETAALFLAEELGVRTQVATAGYPQMIAQHTLEHLDLVRRSLLPAIVVGVALGVFCQRFPGAGRGVMAGVGLLQTIPSLALLVLLLPVVAWFGYRSIGEGSVTAIVALFCYALMPIVRNTYTGLEAIPRGVVESATVLGLNRSSRLAEIELPIALPTILAGIRTSGVQNVGFATLGAIIGAGGLGQPILRGIRVSDPKLVLAGAVPAALLALALQLLLDLLEWAVVPRGLKRRQLRSE